jgi:hypothetical protein
MHPLVAQWQSKLMLHDGLHGVPTMVSSSGYHASRSHATTKAPQVHQPRKMIVTFLEISTALTISYHSKIRLSKYCTHVPSSFRTNRGSFAQQLQCDFNTSEFSQDIQNLTDVNLN